jgi:phospholipid N-methyltransferase
MTRHHRDQELFTVPQWSDRMLFLQAWMRDPLKVGSVTPSAPALVSRMLAPIHWDRVQTIVELGAGTGPMTAEILQRTPPHVRFLTFEREPAFRDLLTARHPGLEIYPEALELCRVLALTGRPTADVIISGIPFASLPGADQDLLLDEINRALAPGGMFIAFQYSALLYKRLKRRFARCHIAVVLGNLPPALVYTCYTTSESAG